MVEGAKGGRIGSRESGTGIGGQGTGEDGGGQREQVAVRQAQA